MRAREHTRRSLDRPKLRWALRGHFFYFERIGKYTNSGFFCVSFLMNARGIFRVQMWGSRDPSWFQESIGVHEGRVSVRLLAWRDTEPAQRERQSTDLILGRCLRAWDPTVRRRRSFHALLRILVKGVTIPPLRIHRHSKWFSLCNESWKASWVQEHEKDAGNCWRLVSIRCWSSVLLIKTFSP